MGRPRIGRGLSKTYSVSLDPDSVAVLKLLGNGSLSAGVRKALSAIES